MVVKSIFVFLYLFYECVREKGYVYVSSKSINKKEYQKLIWNVMSEINLLHVLFSLTGQPDAPHRPPIIYEQPHSTVYFKRGESVTLPCQAEGNPRPS